MSMLTDREVHELTDALFYWEEQTPIFMMQPWVITGGFELETTEFDNTQVYQLVSYEHMLSLFGPPEPADPENPLAAAIRQQLARQP